MKTKRIAVLMGGPSTEREVSFNTGRAVLQALQEKGYNAVGIDLEPANFVDQLRAANIDVVFNAIHGKYGEDGAIQGALDLLGIPYTGSGVLASAIAMDKAITKRLFVSAGIPTPRSVIYSKAEADADLPQRVMADFKLPVVVKASAQGSSIGVVIVDCEQALPGAIAEAFKYSDQILVEDFIKGKEITAAVFGGQYPQALPLIEIVPHSGKYDYHSKYTKGATEYIVPAQLDAPVTSTIQDLAVKAFTLLGCQGVARVDFMLGANDEPFVLEVNTIPGMTATSLVPKAAAAAGISFADLCERLLLMTSETAAGRNN